MCVPTQRLMFKAMSPEPVLVNAAFRFGCLHVVVVVLGVPIKLTLINV